MYAHLVCIHRHRQRIPSAKQEVVLVSRSLFSRSSSWQTWRAWALKTLGNGSFCKDSRNKYNKSLFHVEHFTGYYFLRLVAIRTGETYESWLHVQLKFLNQMFNSRTFFLHKNIGVFLDYVIIINFILVFILAQMKLFIHLVLWKTFMTKYE